MDISNFNGNIKYTNKNVYYPDFYLEEMNLIVEIKSKYTYECDYDKNILKRNGCIKNGYKFIFIIDKNYDEFIFLIDK